MKIIGFQKIREWMLKRESEAYLGKLLQKYYAEVVKKANQSLPANQLLFSKEVEKLFNSYNDSWKEYAHKRTRETGIVIDEHVFFYNVMEHNNRKSREIHGK